MKIAIIGTRGIPANYGGFETFAEEVAVRMVQLGHQVLVIGDNSLNYDKPEYKGVEVIMLDKSKPKNPLGFYYSSLKEAKSWSADYTIMCGVGGAVLVPFFQSRKHVIAVNPDGLGFRRDKYPFYKKMIFYTLYFIAARFSKYLVCDSPGIEQYFEKSLFRRKNNYVIEYGTYLNPFNEMDDLSSRLAQFDLPYKNQGYHLVVSRLEPENNVQITLSGYLESKAKLPIVVVGPTNTKYASELLKFKSDHIHFIGGVYDREKLQLLRAASKSYWHGHSVGGTNPSLLEAMGSKNLCVCHDNIFNKEVVRESGFYFSNPKEAQMIFNQVDSEDFSEFRDGVLDRAKNYFNWERITEEYLKLGERFLEN